MVGVGVGVSVGVGVGVSVGVGVGVSVGGEAGISVGVGVSVLAGLGVWVGSGVGLGVGDAAGGVSLTRAIAWVAVGAARTRPFKISQPPRPPNKSSKTAIKPNTGISALSVVEVEGGAAEMVGSSGWEEVLAR